MKKCSVCKKNIAVLYATKIENGKSEMTGLCMDCAKKMGIPVMDELMKQVDLDPEDIDNLSQQMSHMFEEMDMNGDDSEGENPFMKMMNMDFAAGDEDDDEPFVQDEKEPFVDVKSEPKTKKKKKTKLKSLEKYGTNLIEKAKDGKIDRIVGRHREIDRVVQILNRRNKNNPILIGEPGVGKTAIAEGLAVRIVGKEVPEKLLNAHVYLLDMTAIVAGTQFRGQFEGRMKALIKEATEAGNVIMVIDEVHNIMGAGEVHGGVMNAANILKPALAKGDIQIIGATTLEEYRKHIEKDAALERRFQPVIVDEPSITESIEILRGIRSYYEDYHHVSISDDVIDAAVKMSERYITDRFLPDKAIDVIDEAGSRANLRNKGLVELKALQDELDDIVELKEWASENDDFEKAAEYKVHELHLSEQIKALESGTTPDALTVEDVAYVIEAWTKIPVQKITEEESERLLQLERRLHKRVIGQNKAVEALAKAIRRNRSGFRKKRKPASFIFVGPTGVGKTELAKTLAEELFGSEDAMIRLDMSEFMEKHTVSKLIGAPPGYVGFDQGGQLTEKVRRKPYSVILMDEIEKAHPDVFNMLLQILEDGRLTDSQGRTVFFENTVIIMTSNAGTSLKSYGIGFGNEQNNQMEAKINEALREYFRPEFMNRVDEVIVFNHLNESELREIVELQLEEVASEAKDKGVILEVDEAVKAYLLTVGYDQKFGARPLRRAIQRYVEDEIAELYIRKGFKEGDHLIAKKDGDAVVIVLDPRIQLEKMTQ